MNWLLLKNSLLVGGLTTLLAASFGFLAALSLAGLERRWRHRLLAVAVMALALPPFLVTNCWLHFLGYGGVWRGWLPLNIVSLGGTVWILSLLTWPITLLMVLSAWQRLEPSQLESDVAVSGWWLIRGLLWPLAQTALTQAAVLTFVLALNNFAVPAILQVKVFPAEVWVLFNTTFDTLGALRLSWPLVVAPLLLLLWFARRGLPWPRTEGPVSAKLFRQQLGPCWFWLCGAITLLLCLLSVGLPVFQLMSVKRTWTELPGALAAGQDALWNSFSLAAASASAVVALGLAAGSRSRSCNPSNSFNSLVGWLTWLPFLLPGVLLGIGLIVVLNRPWFALIYQSAAVVILAFVIRYLAVGWNSLAHALRMVDRDLTDVARLDGASRWQMLRYVQWPQIAPQTAVAGYVVFLLCLWDVESMILVVPPGGETLALRVFNLLHYGHNAQVNALCLMLLALAVAPLVIWKAWCVVRGACLYRTLHARRSTLLAASTLLLLPGCAPKPPSNEAPLASQLFRRVQVIGSRGVGVGELNKPRSVAVDAQDNLYVVDMTGRVQKFSSNGVFQLFWQMPQTALGKPKGMGRDRDGNIIVLEPHYQRVNVFSPEGKLVAQWGKRGTNAGELMMPRAVAVNSRREVFLSEYGLVERVQQFAARGEKLLAGFGHPGNAPGEFNRPEGMCVDSQDRIYVADSCNHRIQVFSSDGKFIRAYGKAGKGKGELSYPYDICVDAAGRQYVCEFGNSRIQVFDANDQPLEIIGGPGAAPGQFSNPWGVALDSAGNLYVADSQNHRVQKLLRQ
jgi:ABC-type Fe3+ transport system permease subunit